MTLQQLKTIRKSFFGILAGFWNKYFGSKSVKAIAEERINKCRSNQCGKYDAFGTSKPALEWGNVGKECCGHCGCDLTVLTASMEESCRNNPPIWSSVKNS